MCLSILDAMTEAVTDPHSYKNLLTLFMCGRLGSNHSTPAIIAQKKMCSRIVETLTGKFFILFTLTNISCVYLVMKSDLIVSDRLGLILISAARSLPLPQQRLTV